MPFEETNLKKNITLNGKIISNLLFKFNLKRHAETLSHWWYAILSSRIVRQFAYRHYFLPSTYQLYHRQTEVITTAIDHRTAFSSSIRVSSRH